MKKREKGVLLRNQEADNTLGLGFLFVSFFWLCWVFVASRGLSLVVASGGYS